MLRFDPEVVPLDATRALYDLTRLIRGRRRSFGTGVDRIDLALAQALAARIGEGLGFVHASPLGPVRLPGPAGRALLDALAARWRGRSAAAGPTLALPIMGVGAWARAGEGEVYVNASHSGLIARAGGLDRLDPARRLRRLVYVHDLIPIERPEHQRPGSDARLARLLAEAAAPERPPPTFLTNSADTARRLRDYMSARGWAVEAIRPLVPTLDAPPVEDPAALGREARSVLADPRPFFVALGTIESRKNHLLLLHLWRRFATEDGAVPRLVLIGRRGWENEMAIDMLERCAAIRPHVVELGGLSDAEARALLGAARALLMPSFAEGLGLPLMEAGALGVPAIVSDLPAHREVAPPGTVFLDPLDGPAWAREIRAHELRGREIGRAGGAGLPSTAEGASSRDRSNAAEAP